MDKSTAKIKRRCNKIKQFVFLCCHQAFLGISWQLRCSDVLPQQFIKFFFVRGQGFILVRLGLRPHLTKIKPWPLTKKKLDKLLWQHIRTPHCP